MSSELSLLPIPLDLSVTRAVTKRMRLTFQTSAGVAVDISGATVTLTVKSSDSATASIVYTVNAALTTPSSGIATLTIPKTATFGSVGTRTFYWYEIRLLEANGDETVWWHGRFIVYDTPAPL